MTKERKGFAANERNGQSWWLANKREEKKKKLGVTKGNGFVKYFK
jgi:hypothetical protein